MESIEEPRGLQYTPPTEPIARLALSIDDAAAIRKLAGRLVREFIDLSPQDQLKRIAVACHELPWSVRQACVDFRLTGRPAGGFVVAGLTIDDDCLGPTPERTPNTKRTPELDCADTALLLLASLLGEPFSHAAVQEGQLILDICPFRGDEKTQLASSSLGELEWHNEDAFHEFRADWLLLMCLRNPSRAATTFARVADLELTDQTFDTLFEKRFLMSPDSSHRADPATNRRISVFSGDRRSPFVCLDPAFMERNLADKTAESALTTVITAFNANLQDVVLRPGEVLIVDNLRAVHGRRPFEPAFDGTDRWLRVVNVTADLRKSEGLRTGSHGRALVARGDDTEPGMIASG